MSGDAGSAADRRRGGRGTTEARTLPRAVWVCGSAASGKTEIGWSAILSLGFELIDSDRVFEELLAKHGLSLKIPASTAEQKELTRRSAAATRLAQRLARDEGATIDTRRFAELLAEAVAEGALERRYAEDLTAAVRTRLGMGTVSGDRFQRAIWPRMKDWDNPLDYLEDKPRPTQDHLQAVAREITRRALAEGRQERRNLLIIETGGQTGKTLSTRKLLESEGYETFLVWVRLRSLDDARRRNRARGLAGGRCLPAEVLERSFTVAEKVRGKLVEVFRPFVLVIDNSEDGENPLRNSVRKVTAAIEEWMSR